MAEAAPLYLMHCYDDIFPEDNKHIELTENEFKALAAEGREFGPDDFRLPEDEETALQHLVTDIVTTATPPTADLRTSARPCRRAPCSPAA